MITLRPSSARGHSDIGWLESFHSFSFADYYDPRYMGFRALRVINDDRITPGAGFEEHGHRDMEIVTYVIEGALEHRDSLGHGSVIRPGEVQRMTAGRGIRHSEFNPSSDQPLHLLQIWIEPDRDGLEPGYEQRAFPIAERRGELCLVAAPDGRDGALAVHQDAEIYVSLLDAGNSLAHDLATGRHAYVHVVSGEITVNGYVLRPGDGATASNEQRLDIAAESDAEFLLFDLA